MQYRKKPVVIEAVQWNGKYTSPGEWPDWFNEACKSGVITEASAGSIWIKTLEGGHIGSIGDMIIRGVQGELYPCKPDIFEKTYELVGNQDEWR